MKVFPEPAQPTDSGVRPPPPPPIIVRTMDSDVKSVEQSGGGRPVGQTFNLPTEGVKRLPETPNLPGEGVKIKIPGYTGPEEKLFSPESLPEQKPEVVEEKRSFRILPIIILVLVAALIGAAGYFFIYPMLISVDAPETPAPAANGNPEPPQAPNAPAHKALLTADKTEEAASLVSATSETTETPMLKEVIIKKNGSPVNLSTLLPEIIPEFTSEEVKNNFEEDFTAFIYYDANGAWSGYVLKRKDGTAPLVAQNTFKKIETSSNLRNLFLADPGSEENEFKSGEYKGIATRYLVYSNKNSAVDYAWANDNLLVLTTYFPALKEVLDNRLIK